jgi:sialic acid synthase
MNGTYIIGEIGQNHNGSMDVAHQLIDVCAMHVRDNLFGTELPSMNAVKFTKRDLKEELSKSEWTRPYDSPHSFGTTYGAHRQALELSDVQHLQLYEYARSKGLEFGETLCAIGCLSLLQLFKPAFLKVASRDLTNLPLLEALAETGIWMIMSTGMAGARELDDALAVVTKHHKRITILHCLSQYPAEYRNINLLTIPYLKEQYPEFQIGYSDHSIGIMIPTVAVAMGAEVIEKHVTLDRNMKGSDHQGSLGPDGIYRMLRDIRNLELAMGNKGIFQSDAVIGTQKKLERSLATRRAMKKGDTIKDSDIHLLSPGTGYKWTDRSSVIGRVLAHDIDADEIILPQFLG